MIAATLGVTVLFAVLVLIARPGAALGLIVMSMMIWPEYLRIPVGLAQMSAPRLVALVLILRLLAMGRHRMLTGSAADKLVVFIWAYTVFAMVVSGAPTESLITAIGSIFDTVLIYFTARLALTSLDDIRAFVLPVGLTAMIMGVLAGIESYSQYSPYLGGGFIDKEAIFRYGFKRAHVSAGLSIYFGIAMVILTSLLWSMRKFAGGWIKPALFAAVIGTLSTMSSGPWLGLAILFILNLFVFKPDLIKPALFGLLLLALFLEIVSNRHFYHLIDYLALNPVTAGYRTRLIEVAVNRLSEYWIVGIGDKSIDDWAFEINRRAHTDLVNHFIVIAVLGGLPALFAYIASHVVAIRAGIRAWRSSVEEAEKTMFFGLCCALIALDISAISVSYFGPPTLLGSMLLGALISIATMHKEEVKPARRTAQFFSSSGGSGVKPGVGVRKKPRAGARRTVKTSNIFLK